VIKECAPLAQDHTHRRYRYKNGVDEQERAKNRTKSSVRSKVEHVFQVMKLKFGFVKLRYRGLKKNAHQLFVICGLVNLFLSRRPFPTLCCDRNFTNPALTTLSRSSRMLRGTRRFCVLRLQQFSASSVNPVFLRLDIVRTLSGGDDIHNRSSQPCRA